MFELHGEVFHLDLLFNPSLGWGWEGLFFLYLRYIINLNPEKYNLHLPIRSSDYKFFSSMVTSQTIDSKMKTLESVIVTPAEVLIYTILECVMGSDHEKIFGNKRGNLALASSNYFFLKALIAK